MSETNRKNRHTVSFIRWTCWLVGFACVIAAHVVINQDLRVFTPEVASYLRAAKDYEGIIFVLLYALVAMYPLSVMANFLNAEGLANARHNLGTIKEAVPLPPTPNIKGLNAGRKLRQAQADFVTLKNLHDNGLITDEMFLKRKAELTAALSSNELFNRESEASPPK